MNLNVDEWKEFYLGRLFDIRKGKRLTSADQEEGDNNYIGAIDSNNGVANHIGQSPIHEGNTISLSYNGSVGEAFYQYEPYWATDDVNALYCNYEGFNQYIGLFIATVIRNEKYKFSYGRKWTLENMNASIIRLPIQHNPDGTPYIDPECKYSGEGYVPDWQFMENYIKSLHYKPLTTKNKSTDVLLLDIENWKEFRFGNLISRPYKAKAFNKDDLEVTEKKGLRYITRTGINNGCEMIVNALAIPQQYIEKGNAISIGDTTATCFYQEEDFIAGDHMVVVRAEWMNKFNGLFIVSILQNEQYKYSYGRAFLIERIEETMMNLPIQHNPDGTPYIDPDCTYSEEGYVPDWQFMENYIKSLHYKPLTTKNKSTDVLLLDIENWKEFRFGNLISRPYKAKAFNKDDLEVTEKKGLRYITRTGINNGCEMIVNALAIPQQYIEKGNAISIGDTTATCFYQEEDFIAGDHMVVVRAEWMNKFNGLFIVSILQNEQYKYSYGRAFLIERIEETMMNLPIQHNPDGTPYIDPDCTYSEEGYVPDWQFMEDYIRSLPYGDRL